MKLHEFPSMIEEYSGHFGISVEFLGEIDV